MPEKLITPQEEPHEVKTQKSLEKYNQKTEQFIEIVEKLGKRADSLKTKVKELELLLINDFSGEDSAGQLAQNIFEVEQSLYEIGQKINTEVEKFNKEIFEKVNTGVDILEQKLNTLSGEEKKKMDWIIHSVKSAMSRVDNGTGTAEIVDGSGNSQQEGVPVNDLLDNLNEIKNELGKKIDELNKLVQDNSLLDYYRSQRLSGGISNEFNYGKGLKYKSDKEAAEAWLNSQVQQFDSITSVVNDLQKHSEKYFDLRPDMQGDKQHWRTKLEAKFISLDYRSQGDEEKDYKLGMDEMNKRRELVLIEKIQVSEPEPIVEPGPVEPPPIVEPPEGPEVAGPPEPPEGPDVIIVDPPEIVKLPDSKVFIVDISRIVKRLAWTQAEEKLNELMNKWRRKNEQTVSESTAIEQPKGIFGRFFKKSKEVMKSVGNTLADIGLYPKEFVAASFVRLSEKSYLEKFYQEALAEIQNNKNLMSEIDARIRKSGTKGNATDRLDMHFELLDSIVADYTQEVAEAEEKGEQVTDDEVQTEVSVLIGKFVTNNLSTRQGVLSTRQDVENFVHEKIVPIIKRKNLQFSNVDSGDAEGLMYASNLFEIAQNYKKYVEEKFGNMTEYGPEEKATILEHVKSVANIDINLGLKARDIRETKPEGIKSVSTKVVDALQKVPVLGKLFASPIAYAAGGSAIALAVRSGARNGLGRFLASPVALGAVMGGVFAGVRRARDLQYDRGMELRRQALGKEAGGPRSRGVREYSYDMWRADDIVSEVNSILNSTPENINDHDKQFIAEVYARLDVEKTLGIDLFSAGKEEANSTGTRLGSMREMKLALRNLIQNKPEFNPETLRPQIGLEYDRLIREADAKDVEFKNFRRMEVAKTALFAGVMGAAIGGVTSAITEHQQVVPHTKEIPADSFSTNKNLSPEQMSTLKEAGYSVVERSNVVKGSEIFGEAIHTENLSILDPNVKINLPDTLKLIPDGPATTGLYKLVDASGENPSTWAEGLDLSSGTLSDVDIQKLQDAGFGVNTNEQLIPSVLTDKDQIADALRDRYGNGQTPTTKRIWHGNVDKTYNPTSLDNPKLKGDIDFSKPNLPYEHTVTAEDVESNRVALQTDVTDQKVQIGDKVTGKIFDGREIMSRAGVGKDGIGIFDASRNILDILKGGPRTADGVFDYKFEAIKNLLHGKKLSDVAPQFSYRFYTSKADFATGHAAFSIPLGPDGKITIDPKINQDLFNLLFKEDGKPRLTAEIAFSDTAKGVDHILATNVREEIKELTIPIKTQEFDIKPVDTVSTSYDATRPAMNIETTTVENVDGVGVPIPVAPRKAMERPGERRKKVKKVEKQNNKKKAA